jgi:hypothetical protein
LLDQRRRQPQTRMVAGRRSEQWTGHRHQTNEYDPGPCTGRP